MYAKCWCCLEVLHEALSGKVERCVIWGFRRDVYEICAVLGYYTALSGSYVPTFLDNLLVPSSRVVLQMIVYIHISIYFMAILYTCWFWFSFIDDSSLLLQIWICFNLHTVAFTFIGQSGLRPSFPLIWFATFVLCYQFLLSILNHLPLSQMVHFYPQDSSKASQCHYPQKHNVKAA
jgi:hypothetical protein